LALKYNCSSAIDSVIIPLTAISSSIFAGNDTSICKNKVVPLLASTSGVGLISWSTSGLGNFTSTNTLNSTYQPSTTDTGIIYLRVQQQTSCGIIMDSLKLTLIAAPNPNFTFPSGTICEGSTPFTLSPQNLGGLFSGAGIIGSNQFNPSISGTFNIKYLTNNLGCKDSMVHPITVIAKPNPQFSFSNNPVCLGSNPVNLIPNQAGGTFTGLQVIGNQFIPSQAGSFPIKYLITVGGCADSSLQSILVNDLPDPSFNPSKIKVCEGEAPISLNPKTTGGTFSGNSNIQGTNFLPNTPGTFIIKYIVTQNGCTDSTSTTLTVDPKPNAKFLMNDTVFCEGDPIELLNPIQTGGIFSGSYVTGNTFNPILSGKYLLQHTIVAGTCKDSVVKEVLVHKVPKSAFNMSPNPGKIGEPIQFTYTGLNANSFAWTFGNPILGASLVENPTFTFQEANSKEVKLIVESNGCFDTSIQFINIEGLDTLIIPNVFTPNGDSINDYFQPIHLGLKSYQIQIYNRWGGLVFESNSLLNHWDGTYHLEPCPSGVYFYTISAESKAGRNYSTHGTVTLLR
jgi:gliding motility-associated-like protein